MISTGYDGGLEGVDTLGTVKEISAPFVAKTF
jgi:hypothetical protein